jgi:hypothetical protein
MLAWSFHLVGAVLTPVEFRFWQNFLQKAQKAVPAKGFLQE